MVTSRAGRRLLARRSRSLPPPARGTADSRGRAQGAAGRGHGSGGGGGGGWLLPARHCSERSRPQGCPGSREREVGGESAGKGKGRRGRGRSAADPAHPHPTPYAGLAAGSWDALGSRTSRLSPAAQLREEETHTPRTSFSHNFRRTGKSSRSGQ
ncbi:translation initiation factor IF-2-like [Acinonyx jubatus]|uniref:Translation initiation factor IF-2-like n=1 Tax=Acinonyx jubatus TaxID=32536 RepID=A0ABM3PP39_ACIJB|nr:translation initiation factor IF-2-like [Acinonyx jubatus]